jgi:hypothetical protein
MEDLNSDRWTRAKEKEFSLTGNRTLALDVIHEFSGQHLNHRANQPVAFFVFGIYTLHIAQLWQMLVTSNGDFICFYMYESIFRENKDT